MRANTDTRTRLGPLSVCALVVVLTVPFYCLGIAGRSLLPDAPLSALMFLGIGGAGLVAAFDRDGTAGVGRLLQRGIDGHCVPSAHWWVASVVLMPAVVVIASTLGPTPIPIKLALELHTVAVLLPLLLLAAALEELTWSATLVDDLLRRHSPLATGLGVGLAWGLVHVVPYFQAGHGWLWVAGQCTFTVLFRIFLVWLYINAGRSVLCASTCHAAYNASWQFALAAGFSYLPWGTASITALALVVGVSLTGWRQFTASARRTTTTTSA